MPSHNTRLYLSPPDTGSAEREALLDALDSGWIAPIGPALDAFEAVTREATGAQHAIALSSCTAAIHLALRYTGVEPGDRVYASSLTFAGSVNPIAYERAQPVFIDCEASSWNLDPNLLSEALKKDAARNRLPKALVLTHLYGQSADLDPILSACQQYDVPLIEDAAEALGATYKKQSVGTFGLCGMFSYNGNKILTTSGGGMFICNDKQFADKIRKWSTQSREPAPYYEHCELGFNYRMSNLLAAIGVAQMRSLPDKIARCKSHYEAYLKAFSAIDAITMMPVRQYGEPNYWLSCITIDKQSDISPEAVRLALEKENIESRPLWKPMHLQPYYKEAEVVGGEVAESLFDTGLCLPSGTQMSTEERQRVIDCVKSQFAKS